MIVVQLTPPGVLDPGSIPCAVFWRMARIKASSRVAISTFAEATRSVSCAVLAAKRNAAAVTMIASPIIAIVRMSASPLSLLFRRKRVLIAIRSVQGCQENSRCCIEGCSSHLIASQLPTGSRGKRPVIVCQKKINAGGTPVWLKRENRLTVCCVDIGGCTVRLSHPEPNCRPGQYRRSTGHGVTALGKNPVILGVPDGSCHK